MSLANYQKYEKYIDSGVDWIGDIPEGWKVRKLWTLGRFASSGIDKKINPIEPMVYMVNYTDVYGNKNKEISSNVDLMQVSCPKDKIDEKSALKGDLIFTPSSETEDDIGVSALIKNDISNTVYSYHVVRFRSDLIDFLFKKYICNNVFSLNQFSRACNGTTRKTLSKDDFRQIKVVIPPLKTQSRIADFLDQKTSEIDQAIEKKEKLINLLKEQKDIIIQKAVTQGLDPDVKMKDSKVDWIGEIPEHWELKRAKYLFIEIDERSSDGSEELLSVSHTTGVTPRSDKNVNMFMSEDYSGSKLCEKGDAVFNIMWAWMGALGVSDYNGIVSPSYGVYRPKSKKMFNNWYLENLLRSSKYVEEYNKRSTGLHSSRLRLYSDMFFAMEIGFPDIYEQNFIEKEVKKKCLVVDELINSTELEIKKLKEFKQVLIANAVTGKIKI